MELGDPLGRSLFGERDSEKGRLDWGQYESLFRYPNEAHRWR